jgi:predicted transcriptional regulator
VSEDQTSTVELATELTVAWLSNANTRVHADDVPAFLASMHQALTSLVAPEALAEEAPEPAAEYTPAVSVRKSLASKDHIISMIDGKPYRTLRRHLSSNGLTPDEYRQRYGLKADYPMVAEKYSESRRAMAHKIGLGRKPNQPSAPEPTPEPAAEAPKRRRSLKPTYKTADEVDAGQSDNG